jgi:hypothetical protein
VCRGWWFLIEMVGRENRKFIFQFHKGGNLHGIGASESVRPQCAFQQCAQLADCIGLACGGREGQRKGRHTIAWVRDIP